MCPCFDDSVSSSEFPQPQDDHIKAKSLAVILESSNITLEVKSSLVGWFSALQQTTDDIQYDGTTLSGMLLLYSCSTNSAQV